MLCGTISLACWFFYLGRVSKCLISDIYMAGKDVKFGKLSIMRCRSEVCFIWSEQLVGGGLFHPDFYWWMCWTFCNPICGAKLCLTHLRGRRITFENQLLFSAFCYFFMPFLARAVPYAFKFWSLAYWTWFCAPYDWSFLIGSVLFFYGNEKVKFVAPSLTFVASFSPAVLGFVYL